MVCAVAELGVAGRVDETGGFRAVFPCRIGPVNAADQAVFHMAGGNDRFVTDLHTGFGCLLFDDMFFRFAEMSRPSGFFCQPAAFFIKFRHETERFLDVIVADASGGVSSARTCAAFQHQNRSAFASGGDGGNRSGGSESGDDTVITVFHCAPLFSPRSSAETGLSTVSKLKRVEDQRRTALRSFSGRFRQNPASCSRASR